jgi:hypothetical protein
MLETTSSFTDVQFVLTAATATLTATISQSVEEQQDGRIVDSFNCQVTVNGSLKKLTR